MKKKVKTKTKKSIPEEPKVQKTEDNRYLRLSTNNPDKFRENNEGLQNGELKWSYYTIENETGIHYYLKKNT